MGKKSVLLLLGLVLFIQGKADIVLAAENQTDIEKPVNVIWNADDPYTINENGIPSGFEIDLWRMIAEARQIPYRIKRSSTFKSMLEEVSSGEADLAIGGILINENRSKLFHFSFPTAASEFKIYVLDSGRARAIRVLRTFLSREVLLLFLGLIIIACFFATPVWVIERHRSDLKEKSRRHQFIFILQKTLLLSTDHTKQSSTRLLSIGSLFARVILTAYFAAFILNILNSEQKLKRNSLLLKFNSLSAKGKTFAAIPSSIQASILKSNGAKIIDCELRVECIKMLQTGKVDAILDDSQSMQSSLALMSSNPKIIPSESIMPIFIAFAMSKDFQKDPRSSSINDAIARSYYDGTYARLSQKWLEVTR